MFLLLVSTETYFLLSSFLPRAEYGNTNPRMESVRNRGGRGSSGQVLSAFSPILGFFDYGREKNLCTESHPFGEKSGGGGGFGKLEKVW